MSEVGGPTVTDELQTYTKRNELKQIMNDFISDLLLHKPDNVFKFASDYFSTFHSNENQSQLQPTPLVIAGPSGVGKGTIIERLLKEYPNKFGFSVSHTTRAPRTGEEHGKQYYFSNKEAMEKEIAEGKFIEYANVHGNFYGTSKAAVDSVSQQGKICILDIDVQGCEKVKKSSLQARYVFIAPPSIEELEKRLRRRNTETEESIQRRLKNAMGELEYTKKPGFFDKVIVNDDLDDAYNQLKAFIFKQ